MAPADRVSAEEKDALEARERLERAAEKRAMEMQAAHPAVWAAAIEFLQRKQQKLIDDQQKSTSAPPTASTESVASVEPRLPTEAEMNQIAQMIESAELASSSATISPSTSSSPSTTAVEETVSPSVGGNCDCVSASQHSESVSVLSHFY